MEFLDPNRRIDFMKWRGIAITASAVACVASVLSFFWPGPNWGTDFRGGTEVELTFTGNTNVAEIRRTVEGLNYRSPDVVAVGGGQRHFVIRLAETNQLPAALGNSVQAAERALRTRIEAASETSELQSIHLSEGGDKLQLRFGAEPNVAGVTDAITAAGLPMRGELRRFGRESDFRYEADLEGVADQLVSQLRQRMGERAPATPDRVEWVGGRAGAQLWQSALKAMLYAILFIMVYVAFRFDIRFAPGGVVALIHDALITAGMLVLLRREFNLTTVAALLTIVGYSINDTIVIYDRIRENMARHKEMSLRELINLSTSQTLSRTIITSGVTLLSISAFFIWGSSVVRDMAIALTFGFIIGVYSTIFVAAPLTEYLDRNVFSRMRMGTGRSGGAYRS